MRAIRFRAWDNETEKMYRVEVINFSGRPTVYLQYNPIIKKPLDDVVLMQYTGLKDKHGKEIYEGDVITPLILNGTITHGLVGFLYGSFVARQIGAEGMFTEISSLSKCEIIGNIYENPDLLRKEG